ncbi:UDP-N-acetylglucosamine 2-epimerase (non-hydrolyzing), partial [Alphaproteobacteria bacterium]|nr:UDP-N-acetylglucosamine 2-epimerase (non-hydrolyzing) [Alphaproteobacteria bacterium]
TRPEAIKLAPIINKLYNEKKYKVLICLTAQHRELVDQVINYFNIKIDFDLNLMTNNQSLEDITAKILVSMSKIYKEYNPNLVIVHGDTTTTFATSLSAFYNNIPIAHIEAGLRTFNKFSPFPEEFNRFTTSYLATWHFAPTEISKYNLMQENINRENIIVTGNTVVDAVNLCIKKVQNDAGLNLDIEKKLIGIFPEFLSTKKYILITCHRRENFGINFQKILQIINKLCVTFPEINFVFPKHLNPNMQPDKLKNNIPNLYIIDPMPYQYFLWLVKNCYLIITDSGGIQEEGATLKKPMLILRSNSERPEVINAGFAKLVGADENKILKYFSKLVVNNLFYSQMSENINPFGDGKASEKIITFIGKKL